MRKRTRTAKTQSLASHLHRYGLQEHASFSVSARSDAHLRAKLRISKRDLPRLQCWKAGQACEEGPVVALFSTGDSSEPVSLNCAETMLVLLQPPTDAAEAGAAAPAPAPEWEKLVIVAHTAYTGGMHVSGIIHRSLVWLEWD